MIVLRTVIPVTCLDLGEVGLFLFLPEEGSRQGAEDHQGQQDNEDDLNLGAVG